MKLPEELPEAFVCNCDLVAGRLIDELEKRGVRVPEDCSVVVPRPLSGAAPLSRPGPSSRASRHGRPPRHLGWPAG